MKIVKASNGKKTVKMSKSEWQDIGETAGWMKIAQNDNSQNQLAIWDQIVEAARSNNNLKIHDLLSSNKDIVNFKNYLKGNDTLLDTAIFFKNLNFVNYLIHFGADIKNSDVLCDAVRNKANDIVRVLINGGVDVNKPNKDGHTPMDIARQTNNTEILSLLSQKGGKQSSKSTQTNTPLQGQSLTASNEKKTVKIKTAQFTLPKFHYVINFTDGTKTRFKANGMIDAQMAAEKKYPDKKVLDVLSEESGHYYKVEQK